VGKNKKPMLTVLVEEEKLQRFRDYASLQGISMGAIVNQLIDRLLSGESSPEPIESSIDTTKTIDSKSNTSIGVERKSVEEMIARSIENYHKSVEETIALSIENNNKTIEAMIASSIDNNDESLEQKLTASIDNYAKTSPRTLSLQDIDRLIGSAISSVTKANNEVIAELKNILGHQGAEIDRLSKLVKNLPPTANSAANSTANSKPSQTPNSLSWGGFCELIGEPLPSERNKSNGDKMTGVASNKGFSGWKYNGNSKKFTLG
jgi:predicted house-cleaning noncanonical NTP pyrophosphatase (MazG superfamily)